MSEIKFKKEIETLMENRHKIPDEFWVRVSGGNHRAIWFMDRQKPSVEVNYDFHVERFGLTKDGEIIWGFDSGCSCPTPWENTSYSTKEWKEFCVSPEEAFDADWQDECYSNLKDYLLLIEENLDPQRVLEVQNAEVRRYLIKRIGYEKIKDSVNAQVLHKDGSNELLRFQTGEMYVKVKDTSTEREYLLYVEGNHKTCRSAIAWTFGLTEEQYDPIIES